MTRRYPLIDSHVHFYDSSRPEGLLWPPAERRLPPTAFYEDLTEFAGPVEIAGVILVETGNRPCDDEWLLHMAERDPRILGVIANLQPGKKGFESRLEQSATCAKLKGIRLRPIKQYDLKRSSLRKHLKLLSNYGLTLELGATSQEKLTDYIDLASDLSGINCGLTHLGHPNIHGEVPGVEWGDAISEFAALPNTFCKLTPLQELAELKPSPECTEYFQQVVGFVSNAFGENRVVFGSNWPSSSSPGGYETTVRLYEEMFKRNDQLLNKLLSLNSRRIYGLQNLDPV